MHTTGGPAREVARKASEHSFGAFLGQPAKWPRKASEHSFGAFLGPAREVAQEGFRAQFWSISGPSPRSGPGRLLNRPQATPRGPQKARGGPKRPQEATGGHIRDKNNVFYEVLGEHLAHAYTK